MQLPQSVVKDNADRRGKVQAADFLLRQRNDERAVVITREDFRRQATCLRAEKQAVSRLDIDLRVRARSPGAQAEDTVTVGKRYLEIGHGGVMMDFDMRPVVEPGAE